MGKVVNNRNALLGWAVWRLGKRTVRSHGGGRKRSAVIIAAAAAGGVLLFWRKQQHTDEVEA